MSSTPESPSAPDPALDARLRSEALDAAVRSQRGPETGEELAVKAEILLAFLQGAPVERPGTVVLAGVDLVTIERGIEQGGLRRDDPVENALARRLVAARLHQEETAWKAAKQ